MPMFAMNPSIEQAWHERVTAIRELSAEIPARMAKAGASHEQLGNVAIQLEIVSRAFFDLEQHWSGWLPIAFGWRDIVDLLSAIDATIAPSFGEPLAVKEAVSKNEVAFCKACVGDLARLIEHANARHLDWHNGKFLDKEEEKFADIDESQDELRDLIMAETVPENLLRATPKIFQNSWA